MGVIPGTHFDLTYLNKKQSVGAAPAAKSVFTEAYNSQTECEVGTSFTFNFQTKKMARRIPIVFA
jgi:hypothetical protein